MTRIELIQNLPPNTVGAEIGVQRGDFSAEILQTPVHKLWLVDAWAPLPTDDPRDPAVLDDGGHESNYALVCQRFDKEILSGRVQIIRKPSGEAHHEVANGSIDWAFVDANHTYHAALMDLACWCLKVTRHGILFVHDYRDDKVTQAMGFGVVWAVRTFCQSAGWKVAQVTDEEWPTAVLRRES